LGRGNFREGLGGEGGNGAVNCPVPKQFDAALGDVNADVVTSRGHVLIVIVGA